MKEPGVTAIAHPAPLQFCTNHGVFLFKDVDSIRNRYDDGMYVHRSEGSYW